MTGEALRRSWSERRRGISARIRIISQSARPLELSPRLEAFKRDMDQAMMELAIAHYGYTRGQYLNLLRYYGVTVIESDSGGG